MEHGQRSTHEPSSSTSAYHSTLEELDGASSSVYASANVENAEESTSSRLWTSIDYTSDYDDEGYVRVHPGRIVPKYKIEDVKLLEKIGEGGQGTIYIAQLSRFGIYRDADGIMVAKLYKGGRYGQWPEDVFNLHYSNPYICQFYGYCLEGESFYLFMRKYDCSLREVLDILKENKRILPDITVVVAIIQIALGMCFLHENNILHRDLKADNIFVSAHSSGEVIVRIGDFDVASRVVGTLFWRAPEILQALKEGKRPFFTPKADVYSFAMTCYEILTRGVPLEEVRASDYDAIVQHSKRPKLPYNLNPKVKDLISRCWHQDPEARPTFKEIVVELKELQRKLITGSEDFSNGIDVTISNYRSGSVNIAGASPEASLLELKALIQPLLVKYGEEDFVHAFVEVVADIERYQSEFGFRSFEEHPVLPYLEWFAREKQLDRFLWNFKVFERLSTPIFPAHRIALLLSSVRFAIHRNRLSFEVQSESMDMLNSLDISNFLAWQEDCKARVLPESGHAACLESPKQACDLCRAKSAEMNVQREGVKCCLYVDSGFASMVSSIGKRIGTLF